MSRYYVYHLIDPRDGAVFYVGKGQRTRGNDHVKDIVVHGKNSTHPKDLKIREIIGAGGDVKVEIVRRFTLEADALEFERQEIARIGLGNLTNHMAGYESNKANAVKEAVARPAPSRPPGRPSLYSEELADAICSRVALGENLNRITQEDGMPSQAAVYKWRDQHPEFEEKYMCARARRADARSDRIDDYCRQVALGELDPTAARVIIDAEKWQAGKESPKYGDKIQQEVTGKDGAPIETIDRTPEDVARRLAFILQKAAQSKAE